MKTNNENQNVAVVKITYSTNSENYNLYEIEVNDETVTCISENSAKLINEKLSKFLQEKT